MVVSRHQAGLLTTHWKTSSVNGSLIHLVLNQLSSLLMTQHLVSMGDIRAPLTTLSSLMELPGGNADSLLKLCGLAKFSTFVPIITTTSSQARVVFTASTRIRPASRVGVKVDYTCTVEGTYVLPRNHAHVYKYALSCPTVRMQ